MRPGELIVDSFAGGGGASLGISWALGRGPDIAINHDKEAIALHAANHPDSTHYAEDVWKVDPVVATAGRPVGLMWLSPDCKHFSKAKGGKPVSKKVRGLAWLAVRWAKAVKPRVIVLENVEEFQTWGPLLGDRPHPQKKGSTFRAFITRLRNLGYQVEWKELRACDYGTPTIRRRLFIIMRCDGQPIVWPAPTHGKGRSLAWRTAAECIDFAIPCPSIFERKRPLAENTNRRIARGLRKFVIESPKPFIVNMAHGGKEERLDLPLSTIATERGGCRAIVVPYTAGVGGRAGQSPERPVDGPFQTITAKADTALVSAVVVTTDRPVTNRSLPRSVEEPLPTVTSNLRTAVAVAGLVPLTHHGSDRLESLDEPMMTVTGAHRGEKALASATLIQTGYGEREGQEPRAPGLDKPLGTVVAGGAKHAVVGAFLAKHYGERSANEVQGASLFDPAPSVTTVDHNALVAAHLEVMHGTAGGRAIDEPAPAVLAGGTHLAEVRAFLVAYYGNEKDGADLFDPMRTLATRDRFGLVTVDGHEYVIADIGMRMLVPRELYRAQGFPDSYRIEIPYNGKTLSKTAQVRMCGNSVCPPLAEAIVRANVVEGAETRLAA